MDTGIRQKLEERNTRIINAILAKMKRECPGSVDLIGIGGSFFSGDIHEKSDLDLLIIINDDRAKCLSSCFILDGVGFDLYCSKWDSLENMVEYKDPYSGKLIDLKILYFLDKKAEERYFLLQKKLQEILSSPLSEQDIEKAKAFLQKAESEYIEIMINNDISLCRYSSAMFLYYLEFSIYMLNKKIVRGGIKRIPEEIESMSILPEGFMGLHKRVVCSGSVSDIKKSCTELLGIMRKFFKGFESKTNEKKDITAGDLEGTYEEIVSNWRSKMFHSIDINSPYLSFQTISSCQYFYNMMSGKFNIKPIDITKNFNPADLKAAAECFDKGMEEYLKLYKRLNISVRNYQAIEDFERGY
ncbi:MAG: nucleotidyltransferase domain-containing protein [Treponema sp.]|nr:nucleotidyltransferase domain-containing protein [Treponema sp.]